MMNYELRKYRNWIKILTILVIIAFLTQNFAWAGGPGMLMPDNKGILDEFTESFREVKDPCKAWRTFNARNPSFIESIEGLTVEEKDRLRSFIREHIDSLPGCALLIFSNLLGKSLGVEEIAGTKEPDRRKILEKLSDNRQTLENIRNKPNLSAELLRLFRSHEEFMTVLNNPYGFVEKHKSDSVFLEELSRFLSQLLVDEDVLGDIPGCNYPKTRSQTEKLLELAAVQSQNLDTVLSNPDLYKQNRANNLFQISDEYGVDLLLVYFLDMRYSGLTILGEYSGLSYSKKQGKYQMAMGYFGDNISIFTRKVFLGESPYVYSIETKKLYYYGQEIPFKFEPVFSQGGFVRQGKTKAKNWYFKTSFHYEDGLATQKVDFSHLTVNFNDFCTNMCPFCWRAYREKARCFGVQVMKRENIVSIDKGIQEIREVYGDDVFIKIRKITIVGGAFHNEKEELDFLEELITKLKEAGFSGEINAITSFFKNRAAFEKLKSLGYSMEECIFPLECFTRRNEVLGGKKKSTFKDALEKMITAKKYYENVRALLLLGLADNLSDLKHYIPILVQSGIEVQLGAFFVNLPRQYHLFCDDICEDELNNGHIRFLFEAALIARQHMINRPESNVDNAIWLAYMDKYIHPDSVLRIATGSESFGQIPLSERNPGSPKPDGFIRRGEESFKRFLGLPQEEFTDVTGKYKDYYFQFFKKHSAKIPDEIKKLVAEIISADLEYKIYEFPGILVNCEDYFLGWHDKDKKIIYISRDFLEFLQKFYPTLQDEYKLHELFCPLFSTDESLSHYTAISFLSVFFSDHYAGYYYNEGKDKDPKPGVEYKGFLQVYIRAYIDIQASLNRLRKVIGKINPQDIEAYRELRSWADKVKDIIDEKKMDREAAVRARREFEAIIEKYKLEMFKPTLKDLDRSIVKGNFDFRNIFSSLRVYLEGLEEVRYKHKVLEKTTELISRMHPGSIDLLWREFQTLVFISSGEIYPPVKKILDALNSIRRETERYSRLIRNWRQAQVARTIFLDQRLRRAQELLKEAEGHFYRREILNSGQKLQQARMAIPPDSDPVARNHLLEQARDLERKISKSHSGSSEEGPGGKPFGLSGQSLPLYSELDLRNGLIKIDQMHVKFSGSDDLTRRFCEMVNKSIDYFEGKLREGNILDVYKNWMRLFSLFPNKMADAIFLRIAESDAPHPLGSSSARYYSDTHNCVIIPFDKAFVELLLRKEKDYPEAVYWILMERLRHELFHDNEKRDDDREKREETDIIVDKDLPIYEEYVYGTDLKENIRSFWGSLSGHEKDVIMQSRELFKIMEKAVELKRKGAKKQEVWDFVYMEYVDKHWIPSVDGKGFPGKRDVPERSDLNRKERLEMFLELFETKGGGYLKDSTFPSFSFVTRTRYHPRKQGTSYYIHLYRERGESGKRRVLSEGIKERYGDRKTDVRVKTNWDPDYGWLIDIYEIDPVTDRNLRGTPDLRYRVVPDQLNPVLTDPSQQTVVDAIEPKLNIFAIPIKPRPLDKDYMEGRDGPKQIVEMIWHNKFQNPELTLYPFYMTADKAEDGGLLFFGKIVDEGYAKNRRQIWLIIPELTTGFDYYLELYFSQRLGRWVFLVYEVLDGKIPEIPVAAFSGWEEEGTTRLRQLDEEEKSLYVEEGKEYIQIRKITDWIKAKAEEARKLKDEVMGEIRRAGEIKDLGVLLRLKNIAQENISAKEKILAEMEGKVVYSDLNRFVEEVKGFLALLQEECAKLEQIREDLTKDVIRVGKGSLPKAEVVLGLHNQRLLRYIVEYPFSEIAQEAAEVLKLLNNEERIEDVLKAMEPRSWYKSVRQSNRMLLEVLEAIGIVNESVLQKLRVFMYYPDREIQGKANELYGKFLKRYESPSPTGGRWPFLQLLYDRIGPGWAGQALAPAVIESGLVGVLTLFFSWVFGVPIKLGIPMFLVFGIIQIIWHLLHGRSAFNPDMLVVNALITGVTLVALVVVTSFNSIGFFFFGSILLLSFILPHFIVNFGYLFYIGLYEDMENIANLPLDVVRHVLFSPVSARGLGKLRSLVVIEDPYEVQKAKIYELLEMIKKDPEVEMEFGDELYLKISIEAAFEQIKLDKIKSKLSDKLGLVDIINVYIYNQLKKDPDESLTELADKYRDLLMGKLQEIRRRGYSGKKFLIELFKSDKIQEKEGKVPVEDLDFKDVQPFDPQKSIAEEFREMAEIKEGGLVRIHRNFMHNIGVLSNRNIHFNVSFSDNKKVFPTSLLKSLLYGISLHEVWGHLQEDYSVDPDETNALMSTGWRYRSLNLAVLFWYFNFFCPRKTDFSVGEVRNIMKEFLHPEFNPSLSWMNNDLRNRIIRIVCEIHNAWQNGEKEIGIVIERIPPPDKKKKNIRKTKIEEKIKERNLPLEMGLEEIIKWAKYLSYPGRDQNLSLAGLLLEWTRYKGIENSRYQELRGYYKRQLRFGKEFQKILECLEAGYESKRKEANRLYEEMKQVYSGGGKGLDPEFSGFLINFLEEILSFDNFAQLSIREQAKQIEELLAEEEEYVKRIKKLLKEKEPDISEQDLQPGVFFPYPFYPLDIAKGYIRIFELKWKKTNRDWKKRIARIERSLGELDSALHGKAGVNLYAGNIGTAKVYARGIRNSEDRKTFLTTVHSREIAESYRKTPSGSPVHLPYYLWKGFKQILEEAHENREISEEVYDRVVVQGLGVGRYVDGEVIIEEEVIPLLVEFLNKVLTKTKDKKLTKEDVIEYIRYHEETHKIIQENYMLVFYDLFGEGEEGIGVFAQYEKFLNEMKRCFVNNYGKEYEDHNACFEEMIAVYITEKDLLGRENILLTDKSGPKRSLMPIPSGPVDFKIFFEYFRLIVDELRLAEYTSKFSGSDKNLDRTYVRNLVDILKGILKRKKKQMLKANLLEEEDIELIRLTISLAESLLAEDPVQVLLTIDRLSKKISAFEKRILEDDKKGGVKNLKFWLGRYPFLIIELQRQFRNDEVLAHIDAFEKICLKYKEVLKLELEKQDDLPRWYLNVIYFFKGGSMISVAAGQNKDEAHGLLEEGRRCLKEWIGYVDSESDPDDIALIDEGNYTIGWSCLIEQEYEQALEHFNKITTDGIETVLDLYRLVCKFCLNVQRERTGKAISNLDAITDLMKEDEGITEIGGNRLVEFLCSLPDDRRGMIWSEILKRLEEEEVVIKLLHSIFTHDLEVSKAIALFPDISIEELLDKDEFDGRTKELILLDKICAIDEKYRREEKKGKEKRLIKLGRVTVTMIYTSLEDEVVGDIAGYVRECLKEMDKDVVMQIKGWGLRSKVVITLFEEKEQQIKSEFTERFKERGLFDATVARLWQRYVQDPDFEGLLGEVAMVKWIVHQSVKGIRLAYGKILTFSEEEERGLLNSFFLVQEVHDKDKWVENRLKEAVRDKILSLLEKLDKLEIEISYQWDDDKDVRENKNLLSEELEERHDEIENEIEEYIDLAESCLNGLDMEGAKEVINAIEKNILKLRKLGSLLGKEIKSIEESYSKLQDLCRRIQEVLEEIERIEKVASLVPKRTRYEALLNRIKDKDYPETLVKKVKDALEEVVDEIEVVRELLGEEYKELLERFGLEEKDVDSEKVNGYVASLDTEGLKKYLKAVAGNKYRKALNGLKEIVAALEKAELREEEITGVEEEVTRTKDSIPEEILEELKEEYNFILAQLEGVKSLFNKFTVLKRRFPDLDHDRLYNKILVENRDENIDIITAAVLNDPEFQKRGNAKYAVVFGTEYKGAVHTDNLLLLDMAQLDIRRIPSIFSSLLFSLSEKEPEIKDFRDLIVIDAGKKTESVMFELLKCRNWQKIKVSIDGDSWSLWERLCSYRSEYTELIEDVEEDLKAYLKANEERRDLKDSFKKYDRAVYQISEIYIDVWIIIDEERVMHIRFKREEGFFGVDSARKVKFKDFFKILQTSGASPQLAIATSGMYNKTQHRETNRKIRKDVGGRRYIKIGNAEATWQVEERIGMENVGRDAVMERLQELDQWLDEETEQILGLVTIFLLPPDNSEYPYYLRTEIIDGELEYQVAHAGSNKGQGMFVYMTAGAFVELSVEIVKRILGREIRLARQRYLVRQNTGKLEYGLNEEDKPEVLEILKLVEQEFNLYKFNKFNEFYKELCTSIRDIDSSWQPPSAEILWELMNNGNLPEDYTDLVCAMRADGVIDDEDFEIITEIGKAVEQAASGIVLTVSEKAILTEAICIKYFTEAEGLRQEFEQELRSRLDVLGYGAKTDKIITLLAGLKKKGGFNRRSHFDFVKRLEKLLGIKDIFEEIGISRNVSSSDIMGNGDDSVTSYWADIFELNRKQWEVLELVEDKDPRGIIVQDIRDFGPGLGNWLEGIRRHSIDMSNVRMAYIIDDKVSEADRQELFALKPDNVILAYSLEEIRKQSENVVYLASAVRLREYDGQKIKLVEKGYAGPVIELNWCLLMLSIDDENSIRVVYREFLDKLAALGLIEADQLQEIEDPYYIKLPKAEKVLEMWNDLEQGVSYLDIWV